MNAIGSITSATQAVHVASSIRKVLAASNTAPARDADGDSDRSPPGDTGINQPGKGGMVDIYA